MTTPAPRTDAASAVARSKDAATQVVTDAVTVLRAYKMNALADLAVDKLNRDDQVRTVVVAGEVQRGKSSLLNALIGHPGLCPVGVDVTSSVAVSVTNDPELDESSRAELFFASQAREVPPAEIPEWVTTTGARVRDSQVDELPTSAAIAVREARMPNATLVDTPGVGGLDVGLAKLAAQSAQQACVLVLVCDASSPLTAPEMTFVKEATATVDSVVVVVTKTDKNLRRWQQIVAENERILAQHLGRKVTVVGVSSLLATMATEMHDPAAAAQLEAESGIATLRTILAQRLDAAANLPHLDAVRTVAEGLRELQAKVSRELEVVDAGAKALPDLTAERDRLTELQNQAREWEQYLARDLTLLRQRAVDDLDKRLDDVRDKWTEYVNTHGMQVLRRSPQKFAADIQGDLQGAMAETLALFLQELHDDIISPRFPDNPTVWEELAPRIVAGMQHKEIETHQVGSKRHGLLDPTMLSMGAFGSTTLVGVLGLSAIVGVGLVAGVAWIGVNLSFRAIRAGKTNLLTWLRETITTTKATTGRHIDAAVAHARPEIVIRYRDYLRTNIDELQKMITEVEKSAAADQATRDKTRTRLTSNLKVIDQRVAEADTLLGATS